MLNFIWNTWKYWWNETDDEILPVFAQVLW